MNWIAWYTTQQRNRYGENETPGDYLSEIFFTSYLNVSKRGLVDIEDYYLEFVKEWCVYHVDMLIANEDSFELTKSELYDLETTNDLINHLVSVYEFHFPHPTEIRNFLIDVGLIFKEGDDVINKFYSEVF